MWILNDMNGSYKNCRIILASKESRKVYLLNRSIQVQDEGLRVGVW